MSADRFLHFMGSPVVGQDGYRLRAADAVEIEKFVLRIRRRIEGGILRSPESIHVAQLPVLLHQAFYGKMSMQDALRICSPDILLCFGLVVSKDGYVHLENQGASEDSFNLLGTPSADNQKIDEPKANGKIKNVVASVAKVLLFIMIFLMFLGFLIGVITGYSANANVNEVDRPISSENKGLESNRSNVRYVCESIAGGNWSIVGVQENLEKRTLLYECMTRDYLHEFAATVSILGKWSGVANSRGITLEKFNTWFYIEGESGLQKGGVNIYDPKGKPVSWVVVAYHPYACESGADYKWSIRLDVVGGPLRSGQGVLTWDAPDGAKFESEGCLDILAAG